MKSIILDSPPLWLLTQTRPDPTAAACRKWVRDHLAAGNRVVVPEITDYEVRRELLRRGATTRLSELDILTSPQSNSCEYLALETSVMRRATALWAFARQIGRPTAVDPSLDADMILIAQAQSLNDPNTIIATTNVGHLSRFFPADSWTNITP